MDPSVCLVPAPPPPTELPREAPPLNLWRAMAFPFTQPNWPQALAYIGAIQFVPIFGYLIIRGWRFDIARRVGSGHPDRLPDWRGWKRHLREGWILLLANQFYLLPLYVFIWWQRHDIYWALANSVMWFYEKFWQGMPVEPFMQHLWPGLQALGLVLLALLIYPPIASTVMESGTQRYAVSGRKRQLYEVWTNMRLVFGDSWDAVWIEAQIIALNIGVFFLSLLLTWTLGGTIFIPSVMIPVYMWTRGALMGQWIWKNRIEGQLEIPTDA